MSDYDWSMPIIVVIQILTVIVGTFPVVFRWLALFSRMEFKSNVHNIQIYWNDSPPYRTLKKGVTVYRLYKFCACLFNRIVLMVSGLIMVPIELVHSLFIGDTEAYYLHWPEFRILASDYIVRKSVDDIIRFREVCCGEPLTNLLQLFLKYPYRSDFDLRREFRMEYTPITLPMEDPMTLPMVFLVKIAQVFLPGNLLGSLVHAFRQAQEIILFIEQTLIPPTDLLSKESFSYAKDLWRDGDFSGLLPEEYRQRQSGLHLDLNHARQIFLKLKESPVFSVDEVLLLGAIIDRILPETPSTLEDLYTSIEKLFVEMLHWLFRELPIAIFKSLSESPTEEFEERVRLSMKFLFQIESLDDHIDWSLPEGSGILEFLTDTDEALPYTSPLERLNEIVRKPDIHIF